MPVIELRYSGIARENNITIDLTNRGKGPALNITAWANLYSEDGEIEITSQRRLRTVVGESSSQSIPLFFSEAPFNLGNRPDDIELVAEYEDVFGRDFLSAQYRGMFSFRHPEDSWT